MITKIELGSFTRGASSPILLKEKIESDGSSSVRIYQRKDIDSINSFKDKIKTMMKYGIEDFCMTHEIFRPLLGTVGIKRIDHLQTDDLQNTQDLLQSIRSEARTGRVTEEKDLKLKKILENHGISKNYRIDFYEGKYKIDDFFSDLKKFIIPYDDFSNAYEDTLRNIEIAFKSKEILNNTELNYQKEIIGEIKNNLDKYFFNQITLVKAQSGKSTDFAEIHSPKSSTSYLETLQKEIGEKLDEIEQEIKQRSTTPKDEDIKNYLLSFIKTKHDDNGAWNDDTTRETTEIRATIDILFSTSWWISEERKLESLKKVQGFFKEDYQRLPEPVKNRIYPEG